MELKELQCAVKYENSSVLVGGHQHKLLQIDINNEKISKQVCRMNCVRVFRRNYSV